MRGDISRGLMPADDEVVIRSMSINSRLPAQLEKAIERNIVLRIGWTTSGEAVPKQGELGLCPVLPKGSRIRSLGYLGPFTAAFGQGGTFTHQGTCDSFLGAANDGNIITCEREAGANVGYSMRSGRITVLDGVSHDAGAAMSGGLLIVRGDAGARIGGGMSGGEIIVHGDVGPDPGAGMTGGKIIINGRCPPTPPGVILRPLDKKEVDAINKLLSEPDLHIPSDAVCLVSDGERYEGVMASCSADFSGIAIVPSDNDHEPEHSTCDMVRLIGDKFTLALPIPILPFIANGAPAELFHPCLVESNPRDVDIVLIGKDNIVDAPKLLAKSAGFALDLDSLPHLDGAAIDGLLVALGAIAGLEAKTLMLQGVSRTARLHAQAEHHRIDAAVSVINDGSGISAAACLPLVGRNASASLDNTKAAVMLPWAATSEDLAILSASNISFAISHPPDADVEGWLNRISAGLSAHLNRLGLASIDQMTRANLRACDQDTAAVSGLRLAGYDRPMPHWFAR